MEGPIEFLIVGLAIAVILVGGTVAAVGYAHVLVWLWGVL